MNLNRIKKIVASLLCGALFAVVVNAQSAPDAEVLPDGSLKIGETIIPVPAGTVDGSGNLVIGETTIPRPTATLLENGNLDIGGGTILVVPELPEGGAFIVNWFGTDLFDYDAAKPVDQDQWYFSFTFKNLWHFAATNWFFSEELNTYLYVAPDSGLKSLQGVWMYTTKMFPTSTEGSWIYLGRDFDWVDLSVAAGAGEAGSQGIRGIMYLTSANGYGTDTAAGFFFFGEYVAGNYVTRMGTNNFVKLTDPVGPSPSTD